MNTLEKAEFNASVRHIENTRILIYTDSEVPATAGSRKTTTKRKTQSNETNEKCYADNPANAIILWKPNMLYAKVNEYVKAFCNMHLYNLHLCIQYRSDMLKTQSTTCIKCY